MGIEECYKNLGAAIIRETIKQAEYNSYQRQHIKNNAENINSSLNFLLGFFNIPIDLFINKIEQGNK